MGLRSVAGQSIFSGFLLPERAPLSQKINTGGLLAVAMPALHSQNVGGAKVLQALSKLQLPVCLTLN